MQDTQEFLVNERKPEYFNILFKHFDEGESVNHVTYITMDFGSERALFYDRCYVIYFTTAVIMLE